MAAVLCGNRIRLPTGGEVGIIVKNKSKDAYVEIVPTDTPNKFMALFGEDDVDFELLVRNYWRMEEKSRDLSLGVETVGKKKHFIIEANRVGRLETLESGGGKLHFITQNSEAGKQLVGQAAKKLMTTIDEASEKISQMMLHFEVDKHKLPKPNKPVTLKGQVIFINIETLTQKKIQIKIGIANYIEDLKCLIQDCEGIPPDQQRLIFEGRQLDDNATISYYGIQNKSVLHLILRLRGGGEMPPAIKSRCALPVNEEVSNSKKPHYNGIERGAICFGEKSHQKFQPYCGDFIPDPNVIIDSVIIEMMTKTKLNLF